MSRGQDHCLPRSVKRAVSCRQIRQSSSSFGYALHGAGITPGYEIEGKGGSTLDFGFAAGGRNFRVELMRLEETEATRHATHTGTDAEGVEWSSRVLSSHSEDQRQT